jgi:hypothetical protein
VSPERFALAIFQRFAPTLLAYGGTYANITDVSIENILPFAFPFVIGGQKMKQKVELSLQLCIQLYLWLSLTQIVEGPTILVMNHIYNRQLSYIRGVMTCRSTVSGVSLGENRQNKLFRILKRFRKTTQIIYMTTQKDYQRLSQCHAKPWGTLMKQQNMFNVAVLPCWIIMV